MDTPTPLIASLHVALGGAIGAVLRYQTGRGLTHWLGAQTVTAFPWATLTVNIVGSFAMGLLAGFLARHGHGGEQWRLFIGVGLLGGFTTFSAFSLEAVALWQRGDQLAAGVYVLASVAASVGGLLIGLAFMRTLAA